MKKNTLIIKNGLVVNKNKINKGDILIKNGIIEQIGNISHVEDANIINANDKYIIPGVIDPQVHFREPGLTHKEDIQSGSMACAAGGITTFFEMPNTNPATINSKLLTNKFERAAKTSLVNFSFFLGATSDNINEIKSLKNSCGLKIFMGSSTGDLLVDNDDVLEQIFKNCNKIIAVHAEDEQILNASKVHIKDGDFTSHPKARPVSAAVKATKKAIRLSLKYNKRLHILHLSTAEEVEIIRQYKSTGLITCETTPQHLLMHAPDIYNKIGSYAQMNPPIRSRRHQDELWKGLMDGTINCIATDHAPHTIEEKKLNFGSAPSGMPGVQTSLTLLLNEVSNKRISIFDVVKWMCSNPANLYKIKNKGVIKEGYDADITILDMKLKKKILNKDMYSKCGWTAFDGKETTGWPVTTIVNGNVVYNDGRLNMKVKGKAVTFFE